MHTFPLLLLATAVCCADLPLPRLPDETAVTLILHVDAGNPAATDQQSGTTPAQPLKSISAAVAKAAGSPARIVIYPGTYREYVLIGGGDQVLVLEAAKPGTVVISGSDVLSGWQRDGDVLRHDWPHAWGLGNENSWWGSTAYNRRREMVFCDNRPLLQVCSDSGAAVPVAQLKDGEFTVADAANGSPGTIWMRPGPGVAVDKMQIEVAVRGCASGYTNDSRPLLEIQGHSNVVLRGLTVQHTANYIKFGPAISFFGGYPGSADRLPSGVLVEDCLVRWNNGIGMEISNYRDVLVRRSRFDDNGERGAGSVQVGTEAEKRVGVTVAPRNFRFEDCSFDNNNWRMVGTWGDMNDSAGFKMFGQNIDSYTFLRCRFARNLANGFWQDYGGSKVVLDRCLIEDNRGGKAGGYGVLNEMTRGPFTITRSVIRRNGNSGFISSGAPQVHLLDSYIYHNAQDVQHAGQRLYGHEIKINSDTQRDSADFVFSLQGWVIRGCTLASFGNPTGKGSIFMISGGTFPSGRAPAAEFANEITADGNTYSKDDKERDYFPGRKVMYSLAAKEGAPDMDLAAWQAVANRHGCQDAASRFLYPVDLSQVLDPTAGSNR